MAEKSADNSGFQEASILNASVSDQSAAEDELGFKPYVEAIAEFLINPVTQPPLTISIEGEWGSGKSSFMKQLQKTIEEFEQKKFEKQLQVDLGKWQRQAETRIRKIRETNNVPKAIDKLLAFISQKFLPLLINIYKWIRLKLNKLQSKPKTIWFNAWKHDKAEALWAAFALEFLRQISIGSNIILFGLRYDWKKGLLFFLFSFLSLSDFVKNLVSVIKQGGNVWQSRDEILQIIQPPFNNLLRWDVLIILVGVIGLISVVWKIFKNDPKNELAKYLKTPDYENQVAFIERFHEDFKKIVQAYAGKSKVYVFIDDLDRCEVPKSAELMQAINMMIANDPQLIFILGMDREKVAAGIAVKDKDLIPYLSDNADYHNTSISYKKGMEYGYGFLEKFIQIPFQVPQPTQSEFQRFLVKISQPQKKRDSFWYSSRRNIVKLLKYISQQRNTQAKDKPEPNTPRQETPTTSTPKQVRVLGRREKFKLTVTKDSQTVRDIILMVAPVLDYNPRRLKQFINLFRLKTYIASNTGSFDQLTYESSKVINKPLTLEQLGRFTAISLKFPRLIIDLNTDRKLLKNLQDGALKNPADFSPYNETTKYWGGHQKLVELLRSPAVFDQHMVIKDKYSLAEVDVDKLLQVSPGTQDDLSSERGIDYTKLRDYLKYRQWQEADRETYLVMLQAVGREKGEGLRSEELLNFPCTDLHTIDKLWVKYSNGKFGFSVQKEIYLSVGGQLDGNYDAEAWKKFGDRVGWRVDSNWISSTEVIFDTSAQTGYLPRPLNRMGLVGDPSNYEIKEKQVLFSRIEICQL